MTSTSLYTLASIIGSLTTFSIGSALYYNLNPDKLIKYESNEYIKSMKDYFMI